MFCTSPSSWRVGTTFSTSDKVAIKCTANILFSASQMLMWWCTFQSICGEFIHSNTSVQCFFPIIPTLLSYPLLPLSRLLKSYKGSYHSSKNLLMFCLPIVLLCLHIHMKPFEILAFKVHALCSTKVCFCGMFSYHAFSLH